MPTILRWKGYRFLFYSLDVGEPPHIHVRMDNKQIKIWLNNLSVARNEGFTDHEVNEILRKTDEEKVNFLEVWNEFFEG